MARIGQAGQDIVSGGVPILRQPSHAELTQRRATVRACACGRCSACVRHAAIRTNQHRYGTDNYPGTSTPTATRPDQRPAA
jgi:hypothetical protein